MSFCRGFDEFLPQEENHNFQYKCVVKIGAHEHLQRRDVFYLCGCPRQAPPVLIVIDRMYLRQVQARHSAGISVVYSTEAEPSGVFA